MTNPNDMDALLSAYADGELDDDAIAEVEAYIAANPEARQTVSQHRETSALLRAAFPESRFARDIPDGISALIPRAQRRRRTPAYALAIAASVAMGLIGYGAGAFGPELLRSDRDRMLSAVAEDHSIYSRETVHLVEVPAAQTDHLKAWLGKRVNGTLIIPDFKAAGLTFAGGRLVVLDGEPVAELMYTRDNGLPIGFCILYHVGKPDTVVVARRGDVNLATWADGTHSYIVVGEAASDVVRQLATLARAQL
jgi:anti-sigma factor RsiW